jgi:signal transduction histidine kinase
VLVTVVAAAAATVQALDIIVRSPAFSTAGSVSGGPLVLVAPVAVCLVAAVGRWWRHPDRWRPGTLAAATGLGWSLAEWDNPDAGSAMVFSLGLAGFASAPAVVLHTALGGTRGRLDRGPAGLVVALGYAVTVGLQGVSVAVLSDPAASGCANCADNLWNAGGPSDRLGAVEAAGVRAGLVWAVIATAVLLAALARASAARRRADGPRWLGALLFLVLTVASYGHSLGRGFLGEDAVDRRIWIGQSVALCLLGAAMGAEVLRERRAARALARVVVDLSGATSYGTLRGALAARLGDPGLQLAFPVGREGELVDERARPVTLGASSDRVATPLRYAGRPLAILIHRRGVLGSPESVDDLVATIHLGLEHERLQAEALAHVGELRASGVRLVETADEERRKLERDLHDGAQQRLVGLALGLRLLASQTGDTPAVLAASHELQSAIDDLRGLARGLAPLLLSEAGLGVALRALAESRPIRVDEATTERFRPVVETTAYAVADRATARTPAAVAVRVRAGLLEVSVTTLDEESDAQLDVTGLADLVDRATTLGGGLEVGPREVRLTLPT